MKYCVIKDTAKIIDGSENPQEIMLQNAQNAGYTETEVEILTEEEYQVRKSLEPTPAEPTEIEELRLEQAQANTEIIELIIATTGGTA